MIWTTSVPSKKPGGQHGCVENPKLQETTGLDPHPPHARVLDVDDDSRCTILLSVDRGGGKHQRALSRWHVDCHHRCTFGRNPHSPRGLGKIGCFPHLHLHVQPRFQSGSATNVASDSAPYFGHGKKGTIRYSVTRQNDADGIASAS